VIARRFGATAASALLATLCACCSGETKPVTTTSAGASGPVAYADAKGDFLQRLKDGTTVNVDAPGLAPVAADAFASATEGLAKPAAGNEGIVVAASEADALVGFDGYPAEKVGASTAKGWYRLVRALASGPHSVRVAKDGYYPVETQVVVRPGAYEVVAVRLGKVVMRMVPAPK
jgi:hypothetical protein